jgi:hypothetical protein
MAVTEATRHALYQRLDVVLGQDEAATLMEHLPPVGWADVATKQDLQHTNHVLKQDLQQEVALLRRDMTALGDRLGRDIEGLGKTLRVEFHRDLRNFCLGYTTMVCAIAGVVVAAVGLVT